MAARSVEIKGLGAATFVRWNTDSATDADSDTDADASTPADVGGKTASVPTPPAGPARPHGQVAVFFREPKTGARSVVTTIEWVFQNRVLLVRNALIAEIPATSPKECPRALCVMFRAPIENDPARIAIVEIDRKSLSHAQQKVAESLSAATPGQIRRRGARATACMDALMEHINSCMRDPARVIAPNTVSTDTLRGICRTLKHLHGFGFACASNILIDRRMPAPANVVWELVAHSLWA